MAQNLTLFYHFFVAPDDRGLFWNWWLDEQAGAMEAARVPRVEMYVTMPRYWNSIYGLPILADGSHHHITLEEKLREYVSIRYPFINIAGMRDTGDEPNLYEGHTLMSLWEYSKKNPDNYVGYVHTKGVMSLSVQTSTWRQYLNRMFITDWRNRYIDLIEANDVAAVLDKQCDGTQVSGNFFFASTNYVSNLEAPSYENRYDYEKWILSGKPRLKVVENTGVDHFKDIYL